MSAPENVSIRQPSSEILKRLPDEPRSCSARNVDETFDRARTLLVAQQDDPSRVARRARAQLEHQIEQAHHDFKEAQDRAWHNRKVGPHTPEDYERKEDAAWRKFCNQKEAFLRRYHRAIQTGIVERLKKEEQRICPDCGHEWLPPRRRKCDPCRRAARRESVRQSKTRHKRKQLTHQFT